MQIHELKLQQKKKRKKRIGRGGKRGTYSGKGQKGQKSRAGRKIRPAERDIILKFPKLKGTKNKRLKKDIVVINVGDLSRFILGPDSVVDKKSILAKRGVKKYSKVVKILGGGDIKRAIIVRGVQVSKSAKKKIESAGGKVL